MADLANKRRALEEAVRMPYEGDVWACDPAAPTMALADEYVLEMWKAMLGAEACYLGGELEALLGRCVHRGGERVCYKALKEAAGER